MPGPRPTLLGAVLFAPSTVAPFYIAALGWELDGTTWRCAGTPVAEFVADGSPPAWVPILATTLDPATAGPALVEDYYGTTYAVSGTGTGYRPVDPTPGHLSWAQLNTTDLDTHPAEYATALGWEIEDAANDKFTYRRFVEDGRPIAGVMRIDERSGTEIPVGWQLYFRAESVADATERVMAAGGSVLVEPTEIIGGEFAVVRDPAGCVFGLDRMTH